MMLNNVVAAAQGVAANAPELSITVSPELQNVLRGVAVLLIVVLVVVLLVSKIKFSRGGMGGSRMGTASIIVTLLVSVMLMDVEMFVVLINWIIALLYEVGQWVMGFLQSSSGGTGGTVNIN